MTATTDLTPREVAPRRKRRRLPLAIAAGAVVLIIVLLISALGNASLFFLNTDEAVRDRAELAAKRFRVQGTVVEGSIGSVEVGGRAATRFAIVFNGVRADVVYVGAPRELFKEDVPVVLEGRWQRADVPGGGVPCGAGDGWYFDSDNMVVKHDNEYEAAEGMQRYGEAVAGGEASVVCPPATGGA